MTEVATRQSGALAGAAALKGNLKKVQMQLPDTQNLQYLRYLQDGNWVFGQENEQVYEDDRAAINPMSIKTGWSCWTDRPGRGTKNENMGETMVPLGQDAILKSDLPVHRDSQNDDKPCEWKEQISFDVRFMDGPNKGKQVHYKTTSVGGMKAARGLIDQIIQQLDDDPENVVPVVNLKGDHYNHKSYGRTYTPIISIIDWVSMDGEAATEEVEDNSDDTKKVEEKKPAKKATKKAAEEAGPVPDDETADAQADEGPTTEADEEEEQPRRRRRRR